MENSDLKAFVEDHQRLFVLTGAGCSTNSGIPDYRDADGSWKLWTAGRVGRRAGVVTGVGPSQM
jgi:NAD-dependent SIR2 family protein deacetylase